MVAQQQNTPADELKDKQESKVGGWLQSSTCKIYLEQALSSWGDRMWSFSVGLYLVMLDKNSLRLSAIYGFASCLSLIIFGAPIGIWIDRTNRLKAARTALILQNTFVAICATILVLFTYYEEQIRAFGDFYNELIYAAIISTTVFADLASAATKICIGKDWIVVISEDSKHLSYLNAMTRRIDLTSLICAPIITGQLMTYTSMVIAAIFIAVWNVVSMFVEYFVLSNLYYSTPGLAVKPIDSRKGSSVGKGLTAIPEHKESNNIFTKFINSWKMYFKQRIVFAGIALSFLYMTVLGFDSITQGYANQQGVSASILGGLSAIGAVIGIMGTLAYPRLRDRIGIERTGLYGFGLEVACLTLCVVSIWMPGSPFDPTSSCDVKTSEVHNYNETIIIEEITRVTSSYTSIALLMSGIVTARFGLWMADLTINQLLQEDVPDLYRGTVNGVQNSINMIMNMLKFILVITFPCHETFGYLIITSFAFICMGWISYCIYSYKVRGHIVPFHKQRLSTSQAASESTEKLVDKVDA